MLRVELDGRAALGDGLVDPALSPQCEAQAGVNFGVLAVELDGLAVLVNCLIDPTPVIQCVGQVLLGEGELRVEFDRPAVTPWPAGVEPRLVAEPSERRLETAACIKHSGQSTRGASAGSAPPQSGHAHSGLILEASP